MSWRHLVAISLSLAAAVGIAACGDDGDAAPTSTTATTAEASTTTSAVDPFTVPDDPADITVEYVEAVLTELEKINGDALRLAMAEGVTPEVTDLLATIYDGRALTDRANGITLILDELTDSPGDIRVSVTTVNASEVDCVVAEVTEDYSEVSSDGQLDVPARVVLRRAGAEQPANATGWVVTSRQVAADESDLSTCG